MWIGGLFLRNDVYNAIINCGLNATVMNNVWWIHQQDKLSEILSDASMPSKLMNTFQNIGNKFAIDSDLKNALWNFVKNRK